MNQASLNYQPPNTLLLAGKLDADSVTRLYQQGIDWLKKQAIDTIDLAAITSSDSTGLALLLVWQGFADQLQRKLRFINMPVNMQAAAELYGIKGLIME